MNSFQSLMSLNNDATLNDLILKERFNSIRDQETPNADMPISADTSKSNLFKNNNSDSCMNLFLTLCSQYEKTNNLNENWQTITNSYNLLTNSNHTVEETCYMWNCLSSTIKRKTPELTRVDESIKTAIEKSKENVVKKVKKPSIKKKATGSGSNKKNEVLPQDMNDTFSSQKLPYDYSSKKSKKLKVTFDDNVKLLQVQSQLNGATNNQDKSTQTEECEADEKKISFTEEESKLRIMILKLKLEFLQRQYEKHFG